MSSDRSGAAPDGPEERLAREARADATLVERVRQGDERAFEALYNRYFPRVYRFVLRRLDNRSDAEETTQEVFINLMGALDSFRGEAPVGAFIFGITRRTIAARFKRKRHPTVPLENEESETGPLAVVATDEPAPDQAYEYQEQLARVGHAFEHKLSPQQQLLFRLHHLEDRPLSEIAHTLDKSLDAVKSNLYRTRKLLLA